MVNGVAHRDGELKLPLSDPGADQVLEQFRQLGGRLRPNLRVRACPQASRLRAPQRQEPEVERALDAADAVVGLGQPVERHAEPAQARVDSRPQPLFRQRSRACLHGDIDSVTGSGGNNVGPVAAQVGLAADDRELARAEPCERFDHL